MCVAVLCVRTLQTALVELQGLHYLVDICCYLFDVSIKALLGNLLIGILDGSLVNGNVLNLLDIDGSNDSVSLVEAILATSVAELQLLGALLDTLELDGRLCILSIDNAQLQARKISCVGVDGHVNLTCIVVLEHERNVGKVLEYLNAVNHLHILLGESLLWAYIITCARCGEFNVLGGLAIVSDEDVGLNVEGQIQSTEGRIVCALNHDTCYLLSKELLNFGHVGLEVLNVVECLLDVSLCHIHAILQVFYSILERGQLVAEGLNDILQVTDGCLISANLAKNLFFVGVVVILLDGSSIKCSDGSLHGDDVLECSSNGVANDIHTLLEVLVCLGRNERVSINLV